MLSLCYVIMCNTITSIIPIENMMGRFILTLVTFERESVKLWWGDGWRCWIFNECCNRQGSHAACWGGGHSQCRGVAANCGFPDFYSQHVITVHRLVPFPSPGPQYVPPRPLHLWSVFMGSYFHSWYPDTRHVIPCISVLCIWWELTGECVCNTRHNMAFRAFCEY